MKRQKSGLRQDLPRSKMVAEVFHIEWSESACKDLEDIIDYLAAQEGIAAAGEVHARALQAIESLTQLPTRCRIVAELKEFGVKHFRESLVFPYRICFRARGDKVVLVGIFDGRRDLEGILINRALTV